MLLVLAANSLANFGLLANKNFAWLLLLNGTLLSPHHIYAWRYARLF